MCAKSVNRRRRTKNMLALHAAIKGTARAANNTMWRIQRARPLLSIRPFLSATKKLVDDVKDKATLAGLRAKMEAEVKSGKIIHESQMAEYLRLVNKVNPREAAAIIERGWQDKSIPVTEPILREYFSSVGALKRFDQINIQALLKMLNTENPGKGDAILSAAMASRTSNTGGFSAGSAPNDPLYIKTLASDKSHWPKTVMNLLWFLFIISMAGQLMDAQGGGGSGIAGILGKNVVNVAEVSDKTFDDVVGVDEAKAELEEIVAYLIDPSKFTRLGGKLPKGVLLTGSPGVGKTLLARAVAGEAGVPFFYTSGSEFEEMFVGVGAARVRKLFEAAKAKAPCIIFIDEIDAIGGKRSEKDQSAMKMTLNQLLVEMDGFSPTQNIIIIAATNFPESLDKALTRPGRLDKVVDVPMPDIGGRMAILELYCKKIPLADDVSIEQIARGTPGFSGASLSNLVNQAAVKASVDNMQTVNMAAFEWAKDKIMMGSERKTAIISEETMRTTAFHEGGHALVALKTAHTNPVHKATIMPRGRALGMVLQMPDGDQTSMTRAELLAYMDVCMGGRVAEELVFGYDAVTPGAVSDIQQATNVARSMVTKYGLSDKLGVMFLDERDKLSGETQKLVDDEVRRMLTESYERAKKILTTNRHELDLIAAGLLEYESLSGSELVDLTRGIKPSNVEAKRSQRPSRPAKEIPTKSRAAIKKEKEQAAQAEQTSAAATPGKKTGSPGFFANLIGGSGSSSTSVQPTAPAAGTAVPASESRKPNDVAKLSANNETKRAVNPILTKAVPKDLKAPSSTAGPAKPADARAAPAVTSGGNSSGEKTRGPPTA